jgi:hypothetical protein
MFTQLSTAAVVGYDGGQNVREEERRVKPAAPQTTRERAELLLRATFLPGWSPTASQGLVWTIRGALVLGVIILVASAVDKTLWAWLDLLIVPSVIAIGGYLFNSSQNRATQAAAEQRVQADALEAYLDDMSDMLIPKKDQPSLSDKSVPESLRSLARARTLTVLMRLDRRQKGSVVGFLYETGLIAKNSPIVGLHDGNLYDAYLVSANLSEADLSGAYLSEANLGNANLSGANLSGASLGNADLDVAKLGEANLSEAFMPGADLWGAELSGAELSGAVLSGAYLRKANLSGANLSGANLSEADLSEAVGITNEKLEQQAKSLKGAIMPDGSKHP